MLAAYRFAVKEQRAHASLRRSGKLKYTTDEEESHKSGALIRHLAWWKECKLVSSAEDKVIKEWEIIVQDDTTRLVLKNSRCCNLL